MCQFINNVSIFGTREECRNDIRRKYGIYYNAQNYAIKVI